MKRVIFGLVVFIGGIIGMCSVYIYLALCGVIGGEIISVTLDFNLTIPFLISLAFIIFGLIIAAGAAFKE